MKNVEEVYPLSPMQQGILFHHLYAPDSSVYSFQICSLLDGDLNVEAFEKAWQRVVDRHPVLRTAFLWKGLPQPIQVVRRKVTLKWKREDWRGVPESEQQTRLAAFLDEDRGRSFELTSAPLMRMTLIQIRDEAHYFIWSAHHLVLDGWSLGVIRKEVCHLYDKFSRLMEPDLEPSPPYREYIAWLEKQDLAEAEVFWRRELAGYTTPSRILAEIGKEEVTPDWSHAEEMHLEIPEAVSETIQNFCREHKLTLSTLFHGAWALLLGCYTGEGEVVFGSTTAGRPPELDGVESIIGVFINTLPVRVVLSPEAVVLPWLKNLYKKQAEIRQYEYCPLNKIQGWSEIPKGLPLFESIVAFQSRPRADYAETWAPGLVEQDSRSFQRSHYPLVGVAAPGERLLLAVEYDGRSFEAGTVKRMLGHLQRILEVMVANPEGRLSDLSVLTSEEYQQTVIEWNTTAENYPRDRCIHELFEEQVDRTPDAAAVVFKDEVLSYRELDRRSNELACYLSRQDVGPEIAVGLCAERTPEMLIGMMGILKAGGIYLPLDPSYPRARISFMLSDAGADLLLTTTDLLSRMPAVGLKRVCLDGEWPEIEELPGGDETAPVSDLDPSNAAYVIYTSGSTGRPKGVVVTHRGLVNYVSWSCRQYGVGGGKGSAVHSSIGFDLTMTSLFPSLVSGDSVWLVPEEAGIEGLGSAVKAHSAFGLLKVTPSHLGLLREQLSEEGVCRSAEVIVIGGEPLSGDQISFRRPEGAQARLINEYGPTEAVVGCCTYEVEVGEEYINDVPIGRPISNARLYVLDRFLNPVPVGVKGELYIGGEVLARDYVNRPDQTSSCFVPNPFAEKPGERMYRTGDIVRCRSDGILSFLGREDGQVKVRGYRIELGEVESVLKGLGGVRDAVVVYRGDDREGRLVGYVVSESGTAPTVSELREELLEHLPDYMLPSVFVHLDALPLTAHGKVDRSGLPDPDGARPELGSAYTAPRNTVEEVLAKIWANLLEVDRVGIHDNFFELGGDSILVIQVIAQANRFNLRLTPKQLFDFPTINELGELAGTAAVVAAEQGLVTGPVPLTPIQKWFFEQAPSEDCHSIMEYLFEPREPLDPDLLKGALEKLIAHHDAVRLRFRNTEAGWEQRNVGQEQGIPFECVRLAGLSERERLAAMETKAAEARGSLNWTNGPLLQVVYFDFGEGQADRLYIVFDHLAVDGVSWRLFLEDLQTAYEQLSEGHPVRLPAKTTSFKEWAHRLNDYADSPDLLRELDFWTSEAESPIVNLPVDMPGGANMVSSERTVSVSLDREETAKLLREVPSAFHVQINDVLLAALVQAYGGWTGTRSLLLELEGHGREELFEGVDLSRTLGWFTTVFPVLLDMRGDDRPEEVLKAVKERLRGIPNRGIGYGILRYLSRETTDTDRMGRLTEPEVAFNYLGQFDQVFSEGSLWTLAPESLNVTSQVQAERRHLLVIIGSVINGCLHFDWRYSKDFHHRSTIQSWAQDYLTALQSFVSLASTKKRDKYVPSDFPLARLDQETLDRILPEGEIIEDIYGLTPMQQGMLFHSITDPGTASYLSQSRITIRGRLDSKAFSKAWQRVFDRFSILRTAFRWTGLEVPLQIVFGRVAMPWEELDWREIPPEEQQQRLNDFLVSDENREFDLTKPPLIRLALIRLEDEKYEFIRSFHHSLLDGWSVVRLFDEVFTLYSAFGRDEDVRLPEVHPFREYIEWLENQDVSKLESFWKRQLEGFTDPTAIKPEISTGRLQASIKHYSEKEIRLSKEYSEALRSLARRENVTLNIVAMGVWALLLSRYSGQRDVLFGAVFSGRPADLPSVESMVGLFINTLPLRVRVSSADSIGALLKQLHSQCGALHEFQHSPLMEVHRLSQIPKSAPLFETIFEFVNYPPVERQGMDKTGLQFQGGHSLERTGYALSVAAVPGEEFCWRIFYDPKQFDDEEVERMLEHLLTLSESIVNLSVDCVGALEMLTEAENRRILTEWQGERQDDFHPWCLHEKIEEQVELSPDSIAVAFQDHQITYRELNRRANQMAFHLRALGVREDNLVGICLQRSLDMVVGLLGILKAGAAYVPLDPELPRQRIAFIVEDTKAGVVVTQDLFAEFFSPGQTHLVLMDADRDAIAGKSEVNPGNGVFADNIAYTIYTSGSTGKPKGVSVTHYGLPNLPDAQIRIFDVSSESRVLQFASLSFDASISEIAMALCSGAMLYLADRESLMPGRALMELFNEQAITHVTLPPSVLAALPTEELPALQTIIVAGEACPLSLIPLWSKDRRFINAYGPTETTVCATAEEWSGGDRQPPIGRPIENTQVYILDADLHPVPVGVTGELYIGGVSLARGYQNRPDLTAQSFIPNPYSDRPGARLYQTGDLARYLPDGRIDYLKRIDHQVKVHGFRIESEEIEYNLMAHDAVREAVVLAMGEDLTEKHLVAFVVLEESISTLAIRRFLMEKLPYYMIPSQIVQLESLPLTISGKIDRKELAAHGMLNLRKETESIAPTTKMERIIAKVWREVLELDEVGVNDNFLDLGGHSFLAVKVVENLEMEIGRRIQMQELFMQTLGQIAAGYEGALES